MIRGNEIDQIPSWISDLQNLKSLRIENCRIADLPVSMRQLKRLKELGLSDTLIRNIEPGLLPPNLGRLHLAATPLFRAGNLGLLKQQLKRVDVSP